MSTPITELENDLQIAQNKNIEYSIENRKLKGRVFDLENALGFRGICLCGYDCKDHDELQIIGECCEHCEDGICQWTMTKDKEPDKLLYCTKLKK